MFFVRKFHTSIYRRNNFHIQHIKFDINKLRQSYADILKIKQIESDANVKHFGGISVNRIPGDPESNNLRGLFYTKPDSTGVEVTRDSEIDESKYTELVPEFENTYIDYVYNELKKHYKIGRVRLLLKEPRSTLSWHRDPEPRIHIPIITNPGAIMVIEDKAVHMPADGRVWVTNNTKYHNFFNGGEEDRIHLVAGILDYTFD